jgi:cytochrome c-type biogenesis protein
MRVGRISQQTALGLPSIRALAALCSVGAAGVHGALAPEHFAEWWGYGWFFVVVTIVQGAYGIGLITPGGRLFANPAYLIAGIAFNAWIAGFYAVTRISGIPLFGPHAGHVEALDMAGAVSKALEAGTVVSLSALLFWKPESRETLRNRMRWAGIALAAVAASVALLWGFAAVQQRTEFPSDAGTAAPSAGAAGEPSVTGATSALPAYNELYPLLARSGVGPQGTAVEAFYAPPIYFQVSGAEAPEASLKRPTLVFVVEEADHEHLTGIAPQPPQVRLRVDARTPVAPYLTTVLYEAGDHRTTQLLFPLPQGMTQESFGKGVHTLNLAIAPESGKESAFTWQLPLPLPGVTAPAARVSGLTKLLSRSAEGVQYGGSPVAVEAIFATPEYFAAAFAPDVASRFQPARYAAVLLTEKLHTADLPAARPDLALTVDGREYRPDMIEDVTSSPHHRMTLVRFPAEAPGGVRHHEMDLVLPGGASMTWHFPISYPGVESPAGGIRVTWVWLLAILGGLIAAMWPCLFQLTVFFIPALAGMSMHDASSDVSIIRRASVVKAALFFVLGFTIVYTAAGGLVGYLAGHLSDMSSFYRWQRYLGIAGGLVILILAVRVAVQVRAPLVCKMPLVSGMGKRKGPASPLQMMVGGVAFATGCMTCFGAAVVVAMVVYVGLAGSALVGALTLFLFSLGMGIPLVIGAMAMARVLPLLSRFEKAVRWMGLASTLVMVGFAVLLITGNYMALTEWVYRVLPAQGF